MTTRPATGRGSWTVSNSSSRLEQKTASARAPWNGRLAREQVVAHAVEVLAQRGLVIVAQVAHPVDLARGAVDQRADLRGAGGRRGEALGVEIEIEADYAVALALLDQTPGRLLDGAH